eukprot:scaffold24511_cov504-Cylindrotheca_fusiformis.AAC.1
MRGPYPHLSPAEIGAQKDWDPAAPAILGKPEFPRLDGLVDAQYQTLAEDKDSGSPFYPGLKVPQVYPTVSLPLPAEEAGDFVALVSPR